MNKIRVFEAFAGVGSQRMALRNLNIPHEVVGISEIDVDAIIAYAAICGVDLDKEVTALDKVIDKIEKMRVGFDFKLGRSKIPRMARVKKKQLANANEAIKNYGDISLINPHDLPDMDLFTYSFPCQDLSISGKQRGLGEGTRSGLLYECEKIIEVKRPKFLLLENVKNLVGKRFKEDFGKWLEYLKSLGYKNYWKVLNSKDYGIPQNRERVFVISTLGTDLEFEFPKPIDLERKLKDLLEEEVDESYYLSEEQIEKILYWKAYQRPLKKVLGNNSISPTLTARGAGENHSGMILLSNLFDETTDIEKEIESDI
ncbi:C-5 cytosine-specific DNA methylase [[Clostridium] sordellii]|uniref:DNA (cytosine-5-)-methyltransferase n=1 Tax=Paraclostridium sordellii TaxID=1505 RepID=UPI0005DEDB41|nr:DNA (cytosine-5-)-methyltransferase [Paeniclostridium sordellii]CEP39620.1 C-5 cytosine-specific DNA methylase [[Clostridium] sordellii] [Paeniclostridium sordellii]